MAKGDLVMLFTDGLFEVEDATGNLFSQELLHETVSRHAAFPPQEFFARVLADIRKFARRDSWAFEITPEALRARKRSRLTSRAHAKQDGSWLALSLP